jgi:hypothetical protein
VSLSLAASANFATEELHLPRNEKYSHYFLSNKAWEQKSQHQGEHPHKFLKLVFQIFQWTRYSFISSSPSSSSYIPVAPTLEHTAFVKRFVSRQFLNLRQSVGLFGRVTSPSQSVT